MRVQVWGLPGCVSPSQRKIYRHWQVSWGLWDVILIIQLLLWLTNCYSLITCWLEICCLPHWNESQLDKKFAATWISEMTIEASSRRRMTRLITVHHDVEKIHQILERVKKERTSMVGHSLQIVTHSYKKSEESVSSCCCFININPFNFCVLLQACFAGSALSTPHKGFDSVML